VTNYPVGKIYINAGAAKAILERKASLLPVGLVRVEEDFPEQSTVAVYDEFEQRIAKGIAAYSSTTIRKKKGMKSDELPNLFGEVIHRNDMVFD
jgi:glutamate 5-kinase